MIQIIYDEPGKKLILFRGKPKAEHWLMVEECIEAGGNVQIKKYKTAHLTKQNWQ
jgi:hypothetical protein